METLNTMKTCEVVEQVSQISHQGNGLREKAGKESKINLKNQKRKNGKYRTCLRQHF